jgi:iron complex transport system substrate-binding protein
MLPLFALLALGASGAQWLGPKPPAEVTRVVTVAPSLTETVVALGAGERLVGVSRFDELPQVKALPRVGGFNDISVEAVIALKPHLVVVQKAPSNRKPVETLARLGVPVLALPLTTIADVAEAMTTLGAVLHREAAARALVDELASTRAAMRAAAKARGTRPRVLFVYGFAPLVVAGPGSFADELLADCGAVNAAERAPTPYPTYSLEHVVKLAPDVIIDAAQSMEGRAPLEALAPLQRVRWVTLPTRDLMQPGPALARGLPTLCALLEAAPPRDKSSVHRDP